MIIIIFINVKALLVLTFYKINIEKIKVNVEKITFDSFCKWEMFHASFIARATFTFEPRVSLKFNGDITPIQLCYIGTRRHFRQRYRV